MARMGDQRHRVVRKGGKPRLKLIITRKTAGGREGGGNFSRSKSDFKQVTKANSFCQNFLEEKRPRRSINVQDKIKGGQRNLDFYQKERKNSSLAPP